MVDQELVDKAFGNINTLVAIISATVAVIATIVSPIISNWIIGRNEVKKQRLNANLAQFEITYPKKLDAYSELAGKMAQYVIVEQSYDPNKMKDFDYESFYSLCNTVLLMGDKRSREAIQAFLAVSDGTNGDISASAQNVITELNRELIESENRIKDLEISNK